MNLGFIKAMASNTSSLDGLDVHGATIDELAAIKNRDIYDLIKQAMGARSQPLLFTITTNGFIRGGIFDAQYQYACDILDGRRTTPGSYPSCTSWTTGTSGTSRSAGRKQTPAWALSRAGLPGPDGAEGQGRPQLQAHRDGQGLQHAQTSASAWLRYEELNNEVVWTKDPELRFDYAIGGFDAADTTDLNAAKAVCMRPGDPNLYVRSMYWLPQAVLDRQAREGNRRERDNAPYSLWVEQGLMRTCPGNKCDKRIFLEWFRELRDREDLYVQFIGYDPWHIDDTLLREFRAEFGPNSMVPVRQGPITLSQPMKDLKADFQAHRVIYDDNPIDKWCLANTQIKTDVNGNIQPVKALDSRNRIDGTVALLCAYTVLRDKRPVYQSELR